MQYSQPPKSPGNFAKVGVIGKRLLISLIHHSREQRSVVPLVI